MTETNMLRISEALVELDTKMAKRKRGDDLRLVEKGYSRALRQAIENSDWLLEVEALKSIGDVNLLIGKEHRDLFSFSYALALYDAAMLRCQDPIIWRTLTHRVDHTSKYMIENQLSIFSTVEDRLWDWEFEDEDSDTCMPRVARLLLDLDLQKRQGCDQEALLEGYTTIMVQAIINKDTMVETEALKSLGDIYLERGALKKDGKDICKASAIYKSALKRYKNEASRVALQHRIQCTEKAQQKIEKAMQSARKRKAKQIRVTRTYDEHHLAGDIALQSGDLDAAEVHFASALKKVHDPTSPRLAQEEECLRKLADVYARRGTHTKDGKDFAKATALYNAAVARKGEKQSLVNSIKEAERLFLYHAVGVDCTPPPYDTDVDHRHQLKEHRSEVKARLERIHRDHNPYQYAEDDTLVKEVEIKRAECVKDLFKDISEQRKDFIQDLVEECTSTIGPPPCQYAMVGLGSQATELVTPYSDLEFAILIEEGKDAQQNKQYFLNLTCYLFLKIINLGETIIPAMAIKSLNDFHSEDKSDSWFYDSVTPRGFAFDGAMPWASKTPFGREKTKTKPAVSLIQTPAGMARLQRHDIALSHGDHLSDILRYVSYLTGDRALVDDYIARVIQELDTFNKGDNTTVAVRFARASLNETIEQHIDQEPTAKLLDVKKEIYRFPTVAIVNLGLLWGVYATSVWDVIQEMEEAGVVTEENARHLQVLVSISGELRLRTYVANGGQKENVSAMTAMQTEKDDFDEEKLLQSVFYLPDQKMLFRYYYTAIPLKDYISATNMGFTTEFLAALGYGTLYDASPTAKADIYRELLQFGVALSHTEEALKALKETEDTGTLGKMMNLLSTASLLDSAANSYVNLGDQRKAISYFEQELKVQQQMYGHNAKHEDFALTYNNLGVAWGNLGDQKKSLQYHEQALAMWKAVLGKDAVDPRIAASLGNTGTEWIGLGNHEKAISYLERGLSMLKTIHGANAANADIAKSLSSLGLCWLRREEYTKAISYLEQALKMEKTVYGQDTAHPDISKSLVNLGNAWARGMNDNAKAVRYYEEALKMDQVIYGKGTAHPGIATSLSNLGKIWQYLGDHDRAIGYCEQALKMQKAIHGGDKACHPDIAMVLDSLASLWSDVGEKDRALAFNERALKMKQDFYGSNTPHLDTAWSLAKMGTTLEKFGDSYKAIRLYEEALKMMEEVVGKTKEHPDVATLLSGLGSAWREVGEYKKSLRYCERALEMYKRLYGQEAVHSSIAESLGDLAEVHQKLGNDKKAITFYDDALNMTKTIHVSNKTHPGILMLLNNLGTVYSDIDPNKAISYHEEALALKISMYGEGNPHDDIAMSLSNLGVAWSKVGNHGKSLNYLEQALEMRQKLYGSDTQHPDIASGLTNIGTTLAAIGDHRKALLYYERALEMMKALFGADTAHPSIATTMYNMGDVYSTLGDLHEAMKYCNAALEMTEEIHGPHSMHPDIASVLSSLGNSCISIGDHSNAISYHQRALKIRKFIFGHDVPHDLVARSLNGLGVAWDLKGNYKKAIDYYEKALKLKRAIYGENAAHPSIAGSLRNLSLAWGNFGDEEKSRSYKEQADRMDSILKI